MVEVRGVSNKKNDKPPSLLVLIFVKAKISLFCFHVPFPDIDN